MGGRNIARRKQAKLRMRAEEEALRSRKLSTEFEVKRLFYGLLLAFETERITKELISQAESTITSEEQI
jgi:outer membrane protein TolC